MTKKFHFFNDKGSYNYLEMKYDHLQFSKSEIENNIINLLTEIEVAELEFAVENGQHVVLIYSDDLSDNNIDKVCEALNKI